MVELICRIPGDGVSSFFFFSSYSLAVVLKVRTEVPGKCECMKTTEQ